MTPVLFQPTLLGVLTFAVSILLPLLVGLVTTKVTSPGLKAVLLAAAALVTSIVTSWIAAINTGQPFDLWTAILTFGGVFVVAVASHFGVWKPTGASAAAQSVGASAGAHSSGLTDTETEADAQAQAARAKIAGPSQPAPGTSPADY